MNIPMGSGTMQKKSVFDRFAQKFTFKVRKVKNAPFSHKMVNFSKTIQ